jgi:hypothetical protein
LIVGILLAFTVSFVGRFAKLELDMPPALRENAHAQNEHTPFATCEMAFIHRQRTTTPKARKPASIAVVYPELTVLCVSDSV